MKKAFGTSHGPASAATAADAVDIPLTAAINIARQASAGPAVWNGTPITATGGIVSTGLVDGMLYKFHTFFGNADPGTFSVSDLGDGLNVVKVFGIGGGGSGARGTMGAGGSGAEGDFSDDFEVEIRDYDIQLGDNGNSVTADDTAGNAGSATTWDVGEDEITWDGGAGGASTTSGDGGDATDAAGSAGNTGTGVGGAGGTALDLVEMGFLPEGFAYGTRAGNGGGGAGTTTRGAGSPGNNGRGGEPGSAPNASNGILGGGGGGGALNGQSSGAGGYGAIVIRYPWVA